MCMCEGVCLCACVRVRYMYAITHHPPAWLYAHKQTQLRGPPAAAYSVCTHIPHTHMWGFSPWYAHSDIIFTNASEPGIPNMAVVYALHWKWWLPLTLSGSYKSAICPVAVYGQNEMLDIISVRHSVCVTSLPNPVFRGFLPKPACTILPECGT